MKLSREQIFNNKKSFVILATLICIAGGLLRTLFIDLRPLHSDEGVNYGFIREMFVTGYFPYSHQNYHGPSYFYLGWLFTALFGFGEFALRLPAIVPGILTFLILFQLRRLEGAVNTLLMVLGVALSSTLIFVSRYTIHETFFLFSQLGLAIAIYQWFYERRPAYLYWAGLYLALAIGGKETFIIAIFCLFFAFHSLGNWRSVYRDLFVNQWKHFFAASLFAVIFTVFMFTAAFSWFEGIVELLKGVPQWIARNESDTGHFKGWAYYLNYYVGADIFGAFKTFLSNFGLDARGWRDVIPHGVEPHLILLPLIFLVFFIVLRLIKFIKKFFKQKIAVNTNVAIAEDSPKIEGEIFTKPDFFRFCTVWFLLALIVYSWVDYKTPWLIINITLPLVLTLSLLIGKLLQGTPRQQLVGALFFLIFSFSSLFHAYRFNFAIPYGADNPGSYTHTAQGMVDLSKDILRFREYYPESRILIGVDAYWPLPYYLRSLGNTVAYIKLSKRDVDLSEYDLLVIPPNIKFKGIGFVKKYYRLSDVAEAEVYFRLYRY